LGIGNDQKIIKILIISTVKNSQILIVIFYQIDYVISSGCNIFAIPYAKEYKELSKNGRKNYGINKTKSSLTG
jgi:hypothetical protein